MVGGAFWTVTVAVPWTALAAASTVQLPGTEVAVNMPEASMDPLLPPLVIDHVTLWPDIAELYWSFTVAVNCCVPLRASWAEVGETVIVVATALTVAEVLLDAVKLPVSVIVQVKL
jgi:hypothetical protein